MIIFGIRAGSGKVYRGVLDGEKELDSDICSAFPWKIQSMMKDGSWSPTAITEADIVRS